MPKVLFKRLRPDAIIPEYATPGASGMDVASPVDVLIDAGKTVLIKLGFAVAVPEGWDLQVRPRSGLSLKTKLRLPNAPGTIADVRRPWETWKRIAIVSLCANAFLAGIVMAAIHSRL